MRKIVSLSFAFTLGLAALCVPTASIARDAYVQNRVLGNGLNVVVVEDHAAPVVQVGMWYRFGALDETPGKTGLAHGLEHMMFRGTPSLSEGGLDDVTARLGAEENANTANDYTHFFLVLPSSKLDLALHIEADRMQHLLLREHDWQLEKGAVLSEYDGDLGGPATRLINDLCVAASSTPVCGLGALGVRDDIVRSHASDLRHYYSEYYHPNNATLVVVGDINARSVFSQAAALFGQIPAQALPARQRSHFDLKHHPEIDEKGDFPYTIVDSVYPCSGDIDQDAGPAAILNSILNNERSPIYADLVLSGVTLGYEAAANTNLHGGLEHVIFVLAPDHTPQEARRRFEQSLRKMLSVGIPPDLFAAAQRAAAANAIYARDSITGLGDRVGYAVGVEGRHDPSEDDATIAHTTLAQTAAYAKRIFADPLVTGILTPEHPKPGTRGPATDASVSDNFANRAPTGPIVEASWVKQALKQPMSLSSRVAPVRYVLANGLTLYVQAVHENPTVFVSGLIQSTPRFDYANKTGLGSVVGDLLGYGSSKYDFTSQRTVADKLGASVAFGTSFGAHGLVRDLPQLLDLLSDSVEHPSFPDHFLELVRSQTLASIQARKHDPDYQASRAFGRALLANNDPDLREPTALSINALTHDDLLHYTKDYLRPDLTSLSIVGDITPAAARAMVEHAFGTWQNVGPRPDVSKPPLPSTRARTVHIAAGRRLVSVSLGEAAIAHDSPDYPAFTLLNAILGANGTFDTRLMHEIRERRGLVYHVSSSLVAGKYRGTFSVSLSAAPEHVAPAIALVKQQLALLTRVAPSQAELDRARNRLIAGSLVAEESTESIVGRLDAIATLDLPTNYFQTVAARYQRVTRADILAVAKKYLHPENLVSIYEGL